jgi:hypothetical protein
MLDWPWFRSPAVLHLFVYCLMKATHRPYSVVVGGVKVDLEPGQLIYGRRKASADTGQSEQSLRTALTKLETDGTLKSTRHSTNLFSVITVCNWERYQSDECDINQPINQPSTNHQPTINQPPTTNKHNKHNKHNRNTPLYPPAFMEFWSAYPNRVGKGAALKAWQRAAELPDVSLLIAAVQRAAQTQQWLRDNGQYIPHPATWLNQRRWEDQPDAIASAKAEAEELFRD